MAVKVQNTENIRKSKRWDEKDDAALSLLLKKKIREVDISIRESETPYERARLKNAKAQYREMIKKVDSGVYNGDIIFAEMQAAAALRGERENKMREYAKPSNGRAYVNSYMDMDFDYESAFRKTRYYGIALPLIMLILVVVFVGIFVMGAFLSPEIKSEAESYGVNINAMFTYKLGADTFDISITNDGNWPSGTYSKTPPVQGQVYENAQGNVPETVKLYSDLGMTSIDISAFDIIMGWFKTPMLEKTRLDFLEDNENFKGTSYYYLCFWDGGKADAIKIEKDESGNYEIGSIIRFIGSYGAILFLIAAFLTGTASLISVIVRLFSYTTRKVHVLDILNFIFCLLAFISPALASIEGTEIGPAFANYFRSLTDPTAFAASPDTSVGVGILYLVPLGCSFLMMILPKLFKNRLKKRVTFVPKGNVSRMPINDPYVVNEEALRRLV